MSLSLTFHFWEITVGSFPKMLLKTHICNPTEKNIYMGDCDTEALRMSLYTFPKAVITNHYN